MMQRQYFGGGTVRAASTEFVDVSRRVFIGGMGAATCAPLIGETVVEGLRAGGHR